MSDLGSRLTICNKADCVSTQQLQVPLVSIHLGATPPNVPKETCIPIYGSTAIVGAGGNTFHFYQFRDQ